MSDVNLSIMAEAERTPNENLELLQRRRLREEEEELVRRLPRHQFGAAVTGGQNPHPFGCAQGRLSRKVREKGGATHPEVGSELVSEREIQTRCQDQVVALCSDWRVGDVDVAELVLPA